MVEASLLLDWKRRRIEKRWIRFWINIVCRNRERIGMRWWEMSLQLSRVYNSLRSLREEHSTNLRVGVQETTLGRDINLLQINTDVRAATKAVKAKVISVLSSMWTKMLLLSLDEMRTSSTISLTCITRRTRAWAKTIQYGLWTMNWSQWNSSKLTNSW